MTVPLSGRVRPNSEAAPWVLEEIKVLEAEVERLKKLLGCDNPVGCPTCGEVRDKSEVYCGNCTFPLDG